MRISPVVSRYFFIFVASGSWEEARPLRIQRRNSDSSLYCKTPFGEGLKQTLAPTERPPIRQSRYLDQEKERLIQSFLKTTEDTSSVIDESSDSGMSGHIVPYLIWGQKRQVVSQNTLLTVAMVQGFFHE